MAGVVTLGECMVSLIAAEVGPLSEATNFQRHLAGAEANVAVGLARLGCRVAFLGRVGNDGFGTAVTRGLRGEGVDVTQLYVDTKAPTGVMFRERRALGPAQVVYARKGSAGSRLAPEDVIRAEAEDFFGARWLHVSGVTLAISSSARAAVGHAVRSARHAGLTISLDINHRRRLWSDAEAATTLRGIAHQVDVVLGSPDELALVAGTTTHDPELLVREVAAMGVTTVIAKLGPGGALVLHQDDDLLQVGGLAVGQVLDPIGAGDAFCAGFIAGRLAGADLADAIRQANACGAAAVAAIGDMAGLPTSDELEHLLHNTDSDVIR